MQESLPNALVYDLTANDNYVGHGTIIPSEDARGLAKLQEALYIAMERNSVHVSDFFRVPNDNVVLIGRRIAI